jgi:hypothetical protein
VLRVDLIATVHSARDSHINSGFIRLLALESARVGAIMPLMPMLDEELSSVRERYAPMHRLLDPDDELFLAGHGFRQSAKRLRREHRICYFGYVRRLTNEIRTARKLGALTMASRQNWNFWTLLERTLISESSLLYLRWLGLRHAAGNGVAARDVKECLDFLLAAPRFHPVTT